METGESLARATRLSQIQHLLHSNARGLTARELAGLCGVCVRTIQRDLLSLHDLGVPVTEQGGDRYGIIGGYLLPPVSFSLYEAVALVLASRLVFRGTDEGNPHIQGSLARLATVLPPGIAVAVEESARAIGRRPAAPQAVHIFEQVAIAWSTQRCLKMEYRSLNSDDVRVWRLEPYFVDTTGVGYSTYVIGQASRKGRSGIFTFKLDRIKEAELLDESFTVPAGLDLEKLLGSSWGVMWGEETEVKLKFSAAVTRRVKESVWHPSQVIADLRDGGCTVTMRVGSTLEMTPWIRGWGPDVEVLGPAGLRQEMVEAAKRALETYCGAAATDKSR